MHFESPEELGAAIERDLEETALAHPVTGLSPSGLRRRLNAFRGVHERGTGEIRRLHEEGASGIATARRLSALTGAFVRHAYRSVFHDDSRGLSLVALGGFGREELNPHSDVDILCLVDRDEDGGYRNGITDTRIGDMLQFLWDMRFDLGHSTRTTAECVVAARGDDHLATSLIDRRFICGDRALFGRLEREFDEWLSGGTADRLADIKIAERRNRLAAYHDTVQIQAPNIKECPGALRDVHVTRWLAVLDGGSPGIGHFIEQDVITQDDRDEFERNFAFLLRLRHTLHFLAGKHADILDHLSLPDTARGMGYAGGGIVPVERIMHDYYMRAGRVKRLTDRIVRHMLEACAGDAPAAYREISPGILAGSTDIRIEDEAADCGDDPVSVQNLLVNVFAAVGTLGLPLSCETSSKIERAVAACPEDIPERPGVRAAFHRLLTMGAGVSRALRLMHETGALVRLIPEFAEISWHYQYDFYHTYTTDEHSIRVVENLEHLAVTDDPSLADLRDMILDVTARNALYLAGLLHDIGKLGGRGHAHRGEVMAARALARLEFDTRTIELVRFLIREHLLMSHISQRRDIDDDETIGDFVERVGSANRLRMLTLLTFADLMALSEGALTDWKKTLLRELYRRALVTIEKGFELTFGSRREGIESLVSALSGQFPADTVRRHLNLLPGQYVRVTSRRAVRRHIHGIALMRRRGVWASFRRAGNISHLIVITDDYPRALSDICGTITSSGINIIGARIFTRSDGIIIDTFLVTGDDGSAAIPRERQREFKRTMAGVVRGGTEVSALIETYRRRWRRRKRNVVFAPPRVRVHNDVSSRYTVIDVFAIDYTGLLYDITSVLASFGLDIHTARIGTDEDQVADAFYVRDGEGNKIEDPDLVAALERAIVTRLNEAYG